MATSRQDINAIRRELLDTVAGVKLLKQQLEASGASTQQYDEILNKLARDLEIISSGKFSFNPGLQWDDINKVRALNNEVDKYMQKLNNLKQFRGMTQEQLAQYSQTKKMPVATVPVPVPSSPTRSTTVTEEEQRRRIAEALNKARMDEAAEAARKAQQQMEERIRLENLKAEALRRKLSTVLPGGADTFTRLENDAIRRGFAPTNISRILTRADSNVTDVQYKQKDEMSGAMRTVEYTVNKTGELMTKTNRRLLEFGPAVMKNTVEFMKWSAAVSLVLIPLQKLQQVSSEIVQQQDKLVNVMISLGTAQKDVNEVYDEAYKVAQSVSEEIGGVIDAFSLAYRATGYIKSETERFATASKLLTNALTLSKLAGIEEAAAIDTLSASLRQMNLPLSEGAKLLDKWVKATQIANIDLNSLASSFAIAGDLSESAGFSTEQLIGLIATLGETSQASGTELGNMTKAVISGFQSDQAKALLSSYGVALEDINGKAVSVVDIMARLSQMQALGIMTPDQFSQAALTIGGGTRRGAVVSTLLSQTGRVAEIEAGVSDTSSAGAAAEALAKKQETVVSATTRLNNALVNLGTTLGTKGGLLDIFTMLLNTLRGITDVMNALFSVTGKVSPMLIAVAGFGISSLFKSPFAKDLAREQSTRKLGNLLESLGVGRQFGSQQILGPMNIGETPDSLYRSTLYAQGKAKDFMTGTVLGRPLPGMTAALGITAMSAISNLADTGATETQKTSRIAADVVGGIAGALIFKSPAIGAAIGAAISEAFVNMTVARNLEFQKMFEGLTITKDGKIVGATQSLADRQKEAMTSARRELGGVFGGIGTEVLAFMLKNSMKNINIDQVAERTTLFGYGNNTPAQTSASIMSNIFSDIQRTTGETNISGKNVNIDQDQMILYMIRVMRPDLYKSLMDLQIEGTPAAVLTTPEALTKQKNVLDQYGPLIGQQVKYYNRELLNSLVSGNITNSEYTNAKLATSNFNQTISGAYATFGLAYGEKTGKTPEQTIQDFAKLYTYMSSEQQDAINVQIQAIEKATEALGGMEVGSVEYVSTQEQLNTALAAAVGLMGQYNVALAQSVKLLGVDEFSRYSQSDLMKIQPEALKLMQADYLARLPEGAVPDWENYLKQFSFIAKTAGGVYSYPLPGQAEFYNQAGQNMEGAGLITPKPTGEFNFKNLDITSGALSKILQAYDTLLPMLQQQFGYKPNEEPATVALSDGTFQYLAKDWKIVEFLLGQILETEQKQLETNLYNFPSGMQAYVPFSAVNTTLQQGGTGEVAIEGFMNKFTNFLNQTGLTLPTNEQRAGTPTSTLPEIPIEKPEIPRSIPDLKELTKQGLGAQSLYDDKPNSLSGILERAFSNIFTPLLGAIDNIPKSIIDGINGVINPVGMLNTERPGYALMSDNAKGIASSKVSMDIKSTIYVQLDGKTLATAVSRYMGDKTARYSNSGSTAIRINSI